MSSAGAADVWASGAAYELFVGRWSRLVARQFVPWLETAAGQRWLDVGCGSGILTRAILELAAPSEVVGIDPSDGFLAYARAQTADARVRFEAADARRLPFEAAVFDTVVSGLVLNFVADPAQGLAEMMRVARPGGMVAAYVWDYAGQMQLLRHCWVAAVALDPAARDLDEGRRFPICQPEALQALFEAAGLGQVEVRAIDVRTDFRGTSTTTGRRSSAARARRRATWPRSTRRAVWRSARPSARRCPSRPTARSTSSRGPGRSAASTVRVGGCSS